MMIPVVGGVKRRSKAFGVAPLLGVVFGVAPLLGVVEATDLFRDRGASTRRFAPTPAASASAAAVAAPTATKRRRLAGRRPRRLERAMACLVGRRKVTDVKKNQQRQP